MQVNLLFFASLKDIVGARQIQLDVPPGATVADLLDRLESSYPKLKPYRSIVLTSVNEEYVDRAASISDGDHDVLNPGGFTGVSQKYPYGRLYNLYLDPKETRSYLIRKLAYLESFQSGVRSHLATYKKYPPKVVVGL